MDTTTGRIFPTLEHARGAGVPLTSLVQVSGPPEAVQELAHRAQLGAAELERRKARRKAQRASRKRNRSR